MKSEVDVFAYDERYRWEWHTGRLAILNDVFKNDVTPEMREPILSKLELTPEQKQFLLNAYDIDWLVVKDGKVGLVEDKSVGIKRLKGKTLWLSCGYESQPQTLQKANDLGLLSGVLVSIEIWGLLGTDPKAVFARGFGQNDETKVLYSKFYRWGDSAFPSNSGKQIRVIDDFNGLATKLKQQTQVNLPEEAGSVNCPAS